MSERVARALRRRRVPDPTDPPPLWLRRADVLEELRAAPSPVEAGHAVWACSEPWVGSLQALAAEPSVLLAELGDWAGLLDRHSTVELRPRLAGETRIRWENVAGYEPDARECAFRLGALAALVRPAGAAEPAHVRHFRCRARGDPQCLFEVPRLAPREDRAHQQALRDAALLASGLQAREELSRRIAALDPRSSPFPDVRGMRAVWRFIEELEDPVLVMDRTLRILDANRSAAQLSGVDLDGLRGLPVRELLAPASFRLLERRLPELLEAGALRGLVIEWRSRSGWCPLGISARVSGSGHSIVVVARDISEHRRLEAELAARNRELSEQNRRIAESDRLKSEFLANVSHELTTPLTAIKGFARLLGRDFAVEAEAGPPALTSDKRREFVAIVQREAERMSDLIHGLLELSKIESGVTTLDRAHVALNGVVRESLLVVKPRLDERGLRIEEKLDDDLPLTRIDPDRMKQVVLNLLDNAIKFGDPGSPILVRTARCGDCIRLSVRNSTCDLEPADLLRIFERFVQRDGGFARAHGGVGLGLNLVRGLVQLHGGRVWAELPAEGQVEVVAELPI